MLQIFKAKLLVLPRNDNKLELIHNPIIYSKKVGSKWLNSSKFRGGKIIDFKDKVIFPPFIDLHFHWHQDRISLTNKDDLLSWLRNLVFKEEFKFKNEAYAKKEAIRFAKKLIRVGTLGGLCFSSNFKEATEYAFKYFKGDFFIGNTLMDQFVSPDLIRPLSEIIDTTNYLATKYANRYALTPRFAISTSPELLKNINVKYKFCQSHLAENIEEVILTNKLYPNKNYTETYQKLGILGKNTILAHGIYLNDEEWKLLKKTDTIIAHCPTSNAPIKDLGLGSGLFDYKKASSYKIRYGLASDIGGGPYLSMWDVINSFSKYQNTTLTHGLYRATINNYQLLNLPLPFNINSPTNFLVLPLPSYKNGEDLLKKLININRNQFNELIEKTILNGKVHSFS